MYEAAIRGLASVEGPLPVKFPLPNPRDPFSLTPGSIFTKLPASKASEVDTSSSLIAAIAGARAAATQFTKKDDNLPSLTMNSSPDTVKNDQTNSKALKQDSVPCTNDIGRPRTRSLVSNNKEKSIDTKSEGSSSCSKPPTGFERHPGAPSKVCRFFSSLVFIRFPLPFCLNN